MAGEGFKKEKKIEQNNLCFIVAKFQLVTSPLQGLLREKSRVCLPNLHSGNGLRGPLRE